MRELLSIGIESVFGFLLSVEFSISITACRLVSSVADFLNGWEHHATFGYLLTFITAFFTELEEI